jgi:glycosyltransferase involved in cell wall biosynthesis
MKVLYTGVYRDGTGYGQAAEDYILALDSVGVNVVCRPLKLNSVDHKPHPRVLELEGKSSRDCNIVIQHVLPAHMEYNGNYDLNIGLFAYEGTNFIMSGWQNHLNLMDMNIVVNNSMLNSCKKSNVKTPLFVVPHACDFSKYTDIYDKLELITSKVDEDCFIFYTIGEPTKRKNMSALLRAYFTEFSSTENVCLVVKTNTNQSEFEDICKKISEGIGIHNYPKVLIINDRLTQKGICKLHATCHAFVQPSYGEGWSIPAFDAMGFGKTPIVTNCTGYLDYIDDSVGWLVDSREEPIFGGDRGPTSLYTGFENWFSVDVIDLRKKMRECYKEEGLRRSKALKALDRAYEFSHEKVGSIFLKVLENATQKKKTELVGRSCGN